jgi:hypothetical protein
MKFNIILVLLLTTVLVNCKKDKPSEIKEVEALPQGPLVSELDTFYLGGKLVRVETIKKSEFDEVDAPAAIDTSETKNLETDSDKVQRMGDTLLIKTKSKLVPIVNNNSDTDEYAQYTYMGYLEDVDQFVILGSFYEWNNYVLVDGQTGDQTLLWGRPVVSPNGKYIASGNTDLVAQFADNGVQLFTGSHKPKVIGERQLQAWGPEEMRWSDDSTLFVKANVADEKSPDLEVTRYFKLKLSL